MKFLLFIFVASRAMESVSLDCWVQVSSHIAAANHARIWTKLVVAVSFIILVTVGAY